MPLRRRAWHAQRLIRTFRVSPSGCFVRSARRIFVKRHSALCFIVEPRWSNASTMRTLWFFRSTARHAKRSRLRARREGTNQRRDYAVCALATHAKRDSAIRKSVWQTGTTVHHSQSAESGTRRLCAAAERMPRTDGAGAARGRVVWHTGRQISQTRRREAREYCVYAREERERSSHEYAVSARALVVAQNREAAERACRSRGYFTRLVIATAPTRREEYKRGIAEDTTNREAKLEAMSAEHTERCIAHNAFCCEPTASRETRARDARGEAARTTRRGNESLNARRFERVASAQPRSTQSSCVHERRHEQKRGHRLSWFLELCSRISR